MPGSDNWLVSQSKTWMWRISSVVVFIGKMLFEPNQLTMILNESNIKKLRFPFGSLWCRCRNPMVSGYPSPNYFVSWQHKNKKLWASSGLPIIQFAQVLPIKPTNGCVGTAIWHSRQLPCSAFRRKYIFHQFRAILCEMWYSESFQARREVEVDHTLAQVDKISVSTSPYRCVCPLDCLQLIWVVRYLLSRSAM